MDVNTAVDRADAFLLYDEGDPEVTEVLSAIAASTITTVEPRSSRLPGGRVRNSTLDLLQRARVVIFLFGGKGWSSLLRQSVTSAQALSKPLIVVLVGKADENLLGSRDFFIGEGRNIKWRGPDSLQELIVAVSMYRSDAATKAGPPGDGAILESIDSGHPSAGSAYSTTSSVSPGFEPPLPASKVVPPGSMPPSSSSAPGPIDVLSNLLAARGIETMSPFAMRLLELAASIVPKQETGGQVTTTRLIMAAYELGPDFAATNDTDSIGVACLRTVLDRDFSRFQAVRQDYLGGEMPVRSAGPVELTKNIDAILAAAMKSDLAEIRDTRMLSANALVAAMLDRPDSGLTIRLERAGIGLGDIQDALYSEVRGRDPERVRLWAIALKQQFRVLEGTPTEPAPATWAGLWNDNPDRDGLVDRLGVEAEARAFARVAAAKNIMPPLAFGIFGDWGSGKSFFMRLLYDYVDKLQNKDVDEAKMGDVFHTAIVQIRFNAWHYIDTNLWASLVDHIFFEMNRWMLARRAKGEPTRLDKLTSTRDRTIESVLQLIQRRKDQKEAAERLTKAEQELALAEKSVGTTPAVLWEAVRRTLRRQGIAGHLADASKKLGLDHLASSTEQLKTTLDELKVEANRARLEGQAVRKRLLTGWYVVPALVVIVLGPPALLLGVDELHKLASGEGKAFLEHVNSLVVGAATILTTLAVALGRATRTVRSAISQLESYRKDLDDAIAVQLARKRGPVKEAQTQLANKTAAVEEAKALLQSTTERVAEAASEYASGTGPARLLNLVRQRATDGQYSKHLGLVSSARRDFSELSELMSGNDVAREVARKRHDDAYEEQVKTILASDDATLLESDERKLLDKSAEKAPDDQTPKFERIILYIDDLDRCPPDKVIEVLQAVHLLLAFPLFVVVVAVDVRWVSQSLEAHYEKLLLGNGTKNGEDVATPRDYLEKIFQVPYWVRPMTKGASRELLIGIASPLAAGASQHKDGDDTSNVGGGTVATQQQQTTLTSAGATQDGATDGRPNPTPAPQSEEEKVRAAEAADAEARLREEEERTRLQKAAAKALDLTKEERAFMWALAPSVGRTPRRALRFLNVYRVIKASMDTNALGHLESNAGYRALMVQLAISTAAPGVQKEWFDMVRGLDDTATIDDLVSGLKRIEKIKASPDAGLIGSAVEALRLPYRIRNPAPTDATLIEDEEAVAHLQAHAVAYLRYYGEVGRRYSFSDGAPATE